MADHIIGSAEGMSFFDRVNGLQKRAETAEERARFFEASQRRLHNALGKIVETCDGGCWSATSSR